MRVPKAELTSPYESHEEEMAEVRRIMASLPANRAVRIDGFWKKLRKFFLRKLW